MFALIHNVPQGFDEFMNLVIDDAVEVKQLSKNSPEETRRPLGERALDRSCAFLIDLYVGQILLKGDNVALIQSMDN